MNLTRKVARAQGRRETQPLTLHLCAFAVALSATAGADELVKPDGVSTLRLRPQVTIVGEAATLADVLLFGDADPKLMAELSDKQLQIDVKPPAQVEISHEKLLKRLAELGVNRSRVLLAGASVCELTLAAPEPVAKAQAGDEGDGTLTVPLVREPGAADSETLADVIRRRLTDDLSSLGGTPEIQFEAASREFLDLTTPPFQFTIKTGKAATLGLREVLVTLYRDGRMQRTIRLGVHVRLSRQVLIAAKSLNVGGYVTRESVKLAPRVFSSSEDLGLQHPEPVVGQQVRQFVPAGQMIRGKDLQEVDLVKRSKPVTVEGSGSINIRINGVALDNGGYGETVRVRLGDNKKNKREVRGIVTGVATVRLAEEG
jgi:flagella basal body P-ring formation protein FlgA